MSTESRVGHDLVVDDSTGEDDGVVGFVDFVRPRNRAEVDERDRGTRGAGELEHEVGPTRHRSRSGMPV
jgi:hypothetical protein